MRILITGAAGFIGSHLWDRLEADGHTEIVGLDNFATGSNVAARVQDGDVSSGDLVGCASWYEPELIVHCAASYANPDAWERDASVNVGGMLNVLAAARATGARVIYFQTALPARSSYAISKLAAEKYLDLATDVPSLTFRLANIYGPRNLSGPIPAFYKKLVAGESCGITDTRRDFVYITDLVDFVVANLDNTGKLDVYSGHDTRIVGVYLAVCDALGASRPWKQIKAPEDVERMNFAGEPLPIRVGLREGIVNACGWYSAHGIADTYSHLRLK